MSKVQMLRAFVNRRLTAAAEEILVLFERTIAEYEEEIDRQRRLLQDGDGEKPEIRTDTAVCSANVKKLMVIKEVSPEQDQKDPESPHIKEEQEELWAGQQADVTKFTFTPVPLKSEDDGESLQLHRGLTEENRAAERLKTEADGEDCGGHLQQAGNKTSSSSETEDSSDRWKPSREPQSGLNTLNNSQVPVSDVGYNAAKKPLSCSGCGKRFGNKEHLQIHMRCHTGEKTFTCPFCGKKFTKRSNLTTHLRVHTGEKPFTCSVCNTSFSLRCTLVNHMRVHTGEKPFSCSVCSKRFSKKANLNTHMALHTEEKPFKCAVCDKRFTWHSQVKNHKCVVDSRR